MGSRASPKPKPVTMPVTMPTDKYLAKFNAGISKLLKRLDSARNRRKEKIEQKQALDRGVENATKNLTSKQKSVKMDTAQTRASVSTRRKNLMTTDTKITKGFKIKADANDEKASIITHTESGRKVTVSNKKLEAVKTVINALFGPEEAAEAAPAKPAKAEKADGSARPDWAANGSPVQARFEDGKFYPATIVKATPADGGTFTVKWDEDGSKAVVNVTDLKQPKASAAKAEAPAAKTPKAKIDW